VNHYVENLIDAFGRLAEDPGQQSRIETISAELDWADDDSAGCLLREIALLVPRNGSLPAWERALEIAVQRLMRRRPGNQAADYRPATAEMLQYIEGLYRGLPAASRVRNHLLGWLARTATRESLDMYATLMVEDPPTCPESVVLAFAPLLQKKAQWEVSDLFPSLLGGLTHPNIAAAILDLANYAVRSERVGVHPAAGNSPTLISMLGLLTEQLLMIEEGNIPPDKSAQQVVQIVNDTVSLIASLCDALALIGDSAARGKLARASELKHRRIRAEALAALIRLGDTARAGELAALAAEPVVRLRVLAYAGELGIEDLVDPAWTTDDARAESTMALWLAEPSNMGLAPTSVKMLDRRCLNWPGYDEPIDCFLVEYAYVFPELKIQNVGIVGPITQAFSSNLLQLPAADILAAFAGWQGEHEQVYEVSLTDADRKFPGEIRRLLGRIAAEGLDGLNAADVEPVFVGKFFGETALVAEGIRHGRHGSIVADRDEVMWLEFGQTSSAEKNELAWSIYKGRRMLKAFNDPEQWPGETGKGETNTHA
jgi:hypothetical protein